MQACISLRGGENTVSGSPRLCFKCGEGGHIARECTTSTNVTFCCTTPRFILLSSVFFYVLKLFFCGSFMLVLFVAISTGVLYVTCRLVRGMMCSLKYLLL